ncbi:MAG: FkbM family methyltransferase, partial [Acidisphaera sp.]|nr:FkbM family methyltransferase [Acidisphaera sp.]
MTFTSYAQNFEDVLLWRALGHIPAGFYIDVGAAHPDVDSVTRAFYDRGWSGIDVEPVADFARRLQACRPRDVVLPLALGERAGQGELYVVVGTGLSTLERQVVDGYGEGKFPVEPGLVQIETLAEICRRHAPADIHFLKIDVEGSERAVLAGADFAAFRPWIVLVEATAPMSTVETHAAWEPLLLEAGYRFVWFDGLNRFYVAAERHAALAPSFRTPPNVFDDFLRIADTDWTRRISEAETRVAALLDRAVAAEARAAALLDRSAVAEGRAETAESHARTVEQRAEAAYLRLAEETRNAARLRSLADSRGHEVDRLHAVIAEGEKRTREAENWLAAMRRSTSWRLTAPLRLVVNAIGELRARGVPPVTPPAAPPQAIPPAAGPAALSVAQPDRRAPSPGPSPGKRRVVHQFHSGSAVGDAITNSMFLIRRKLRELGYVSDIFVEHRDAKLLDALRPMNELPQHDGYVLIVHHSMGFDAFSLVAQLAAPKVLLYHNITPPELLPGEPVLQDYSRLGRRQLAEWRPRVAAALADSEYNAIELRRLGFAAVQSCMLLFDMAELRATAGRFTRAGADEPFTILFVGRVTQAKGQRELIAAYAAFRARFERPSRLVIVGRHDGAGPDYLQALQAGIAENGLAAHVLLTGLASDDELHGWYAAADLYVSLSRHEGFSVPLIEAMVHGVPVLAWPSSAVPYTLGDAGELLEDTAPQAVAERMLALAGDPARRAAIVQRQYARLDRFTLQSQIPALVQALTMAGTAPPVADAPTRQMLAANMRFTVMGHLNKNYSLAAINRRLALALEAERPGRVRVVPVEGQTTSDLSEVPSEQRAAIAELAARPGSVSGPEIVISHHFPVHVPEEPGDAALALFFWEESLVPWDTVALLNRSFRGVLSPSRFVSKALIDSGLSIPVRTVGFAPDLAGFRRLAETRAGGAGRGGRFTFLHVSSCFPRKGVDVLLAAYAGAFRRGDAVRLVIKGFPNPHNATAEQIAQLRETDPEAPEIVLVDRDMTEPELLDLYAEADAMVLPTRGEGFNIPAAEAMAAGMPLIVTGFGGHRDFCDASVARLIDYRFAPSRSHLAAAHSIWVEPLVKDLAAAMREVAGGAACAGSGGERTRRAVVAAEALADRGAMVRRVREAALDFLLAPPREPLRIAWVSTWSVRCGIAEYSRHLLDNLPADEAIGEITILADRRTEPTSGPRRVLQGWELGNPENPHTLAAAVAAQDPHIVVLQHQPGLFAWGILADLLRTPAFVERVAVVTLHNTRDLLDASVEERDRAVAALAGVARVIVHTIADLNLMKSFGLVSNVALFPQGAPPGIAPRSPRPLTPGEAPLIGCYGFFLPNKGI